MEPQLLQFIKGPRFRQISSTRAAVFFFFFLFLYFANQTDIRPPCRSVVNFDNDGEWEIWRVVCIRTRRRHSVLRNDSSRGKNLAGSRDFRTCHPSRFGARRVILPFRAKKDFDPQESWREEQLLFRT